MMDAYYNEFDPFAAAWLRELQKNNLISGGCVDERSIADIVAKDIEGIRRVHFFAGIGGWDYALSLAGWPEEVPVWTGSCPCQPFSSAGKRRGTTDERHLWPVFAKLIDQCQPPVVFGEQVASKDGREWLSGVFADLERMGYLSGAEDLCAAGVGAPHIRQRLYWVGIRQDWLVGGGLAHPEGVGVQREVGNIYCEESEIGGLFFRSGCAGESGWVADSGWNGDTLWHPCKDGKHRRIPAEPSLFPLVDGVSNRVGLLRGAGNAIVPQVAAQFVSAVMDVIFDPLAKARGE